jgi:hypothetical protein
VTTSPFPRRRIPQPWQSLAQQRLHGIGEEPASQLGSAQITISHDGSTSDRRRRQLLISSRPSITGICGTGT